MTRQEVKEEIQRLTALVRYHSTLYYQKHTPEVSDYEFDQLLERLVKLEKRYPELQLSDSPTQTVGEKPSKNFATVFHRYPMLSLNNTYSAEEVHKFIQRIQKNLRDVPVVFFCELKYDGIATSLLYKEGVLQRIATRGDGEKGDDITKNAQIIAHIPTHIQADDIPQEFEVRGEVCMPITYFEELNKARIMRGETAFANPRNTTAGSLKLINPNLAVQRSLHFYPYSLKTMGIDLETHEEGIHLLEKWGFPISPTYQRCSTTKEVIAYIDHWEKNRHNLPIDTDGIVIKINHLQQQEQLGYTAKSPRWAIAYKYAPNNVQTSLEGVSYQVGRTGAITPVACLRPTLLAGTTVKRASLYNADEIKRLDLHLGDTVLVAKGGDIIPKITAVVNTHRNSNSIPIEFIDHCPACQTALVHHEEEVAYYCPNEAGCPPQLIGRLTHFVHRKAMHIDSIGSRIARLLFEQGLVHTPADLYTLRYEDIRTLAGFKHLATRNLLQGIAQSKRVPFERVLFALGIRYVGETVAKRLARHFKQIDSLLQATIEELLTVPEVGKKIAHSVKAYFQDTTHLASIASLKAAGLQFSISPSHVSVGIQALAGKTLVISGTFQEIKRVALTQRIQQHGGRLLSTVSKNVDYLVAGQQAGPAKLAIAQALKIPILSEADIINMVNTQ